MQRNQLLLVNPWIYDFAAYDLWIKPLGLLYIAGLLREKGYRISFIDCLDRWHPQLLRLQGHQHPAGKEDGRGKFYREEVDKPPAVNHIPRRYSRYGITPQMFEQELENTDPPDLVLMTSGMTYWYPGVQEAIRMVKARYPEVRVILGGIYPTLTPRHAREHSGADYLIQGEGELPTLRLVDELTGNHRPSASITASLDQLPYPAYDLMRVSRFLPILTSRGCPYRCSFCASFKTYNGFRQRDPLAVVDEIEYYVHQYRIDNIVFYDDALLINPLLHIIPLLSEVIRRNLKLRFHTPNGLHPREIDPQLAELMRASGFATIRLSFETSHAQRQQEMGCKVSNEALEKALVHLEAAGYRRRQIEVYALMGLPGQGLNEILDTINFIHRLGARVKLASFSPIPGTAEWERAVREYHLDPDADPLLLNNSCYPIRNAELDYNLYGELRSYSNTLNEALETGRHPSPLWEASERGEPFDKMTNRSHH
ncbi:radical SAM protein [bacterium (candidate division B38) B3_B38]|nr:MAG: radical SAM protein [bacterium (candidate division B38) B3_B38]